MKKQIGILLLIACLLFIAVGCSEEKATYMHFTIKADAAVINGEQMPAIEHKISFPTSALERQTVMFAILYACDALGYTHMREGKYNEILVSVAERQNLPNAAWIIEAADINGNAIEATTDTEIGDIVYLSITYKAIS